MRHPRYTDELFEILGDKLWSIIRYYTWIDSDKPFFGPLQNNFNVSLFHRFPDFPMDNIAAVTVYNRTQIVERPANIKIRDIDVPMFMWFYRLIESSSFA